MKILTLNTIEEKKKRIMQRLLIKYSDKDRVPTAYERFCWLVNFLYPYFKTFKTIMTIFTPSKSLIVIYNYSSYSNLVCKKLQTHYKDTVSLVVFNGVNQRFTQRLTLLLDKHNWPQLLRDFASAILPTFILSIGLLRKTSAHLVFVPL